MAYEIQTAEPGSYNKIAAVRHIKTIEWNDNLDNVFISFSFETSEKLEVGSWIKLYETYDNITVFNGIITSVKQAKDKFYVYSGYDYGFYLDKNAATIQFKNEDVSEAIKRVCREFNLAYGEVPNIPQKIKEIHIKQKLSDILKKILKTAQDKEFNNNYYYNCMNGYVNLNQYKENDNLKGVIANIHTIPSTNTISDFNISSSIENMKTRVQIYRKIDDKNIAPPICYTTPDNENMKKYGLLNHIEEQALSSDEDYINFANKKLKELNKITNTLTLTLLGDHQMHRGVIIPLEIEELNLNDRYLIKSSKHTIIDSKETVVIGIEKYKNQ